MLDPGNYDGIYTADSGALCLDFANTVSRRSSVQPHEWLNTFSDLLAWGEFTGVLTSAEARNIRDNGLITPEAGKDFLERAQNLREAIYHILMTATNLTAPTQEAIDTLNVELEYANRKRKLKWNGAQFEWRTDFEAGNPERILGLVALSAAELLSSPELERVGECQSQDCGWLFLDTSKNHSRRWCSMEDCGNREKARKHYQRKQRFSASE